MGIITFSIITIHTTLPVTRSWTVIMALTTSFIHFILVIRTHDTRNQMNKAHRMEFKLEVDIFYLVVKSNDELEMNGTKLCLVPTRSLGQIRLSEMLNLYIRRTGLFVHPETILFTSEIRSE
jgi:hypothetical protein